MISVVAGVLRDEEGRVLLSQRLPGKHLAGTWEFPGGKCEPGESPAEALARELSEELGIALGASDPLLGLTHHYPEKSVRLLLREVRNWQGQPRGCEGQPLKWVAVEQMPGLPMPAADRPIVRVLDLDCRYAISPDPASDGGMQGLISAWEQSLAAGFRLLQLRAPSLDTRELAALAPRLGDMARRHGARWMLNGPVEIALAAGADGLHLRHDDLLRLDQRPVPESMLLAGSCHDRKSLKRAAALGCDFVCLSPVRATASHPWAVPLGWPGFAELCTASAVPVLALGGVSPGDLSMARQHGAWGVAGISAFGAV